MTIYRAFSFSPARRRLIEADLPRSDAKGTECPLCEAHAVEYKDVRVPYWFCGECRANFYTDTYYGGNV